MKKSDAVWKTLQFVAFMSLVFALRFYGAGDVLMGGRVYFLDGDCYARMTRVRQVMADPGLIVRHHRFENWPEGTSPHTTAPLDYLIAGLAAALSPFSAQSVDLAGALISPLLALSAAAFLWFWCGGWEGRRYRALMMLLFAVSPGVMHATAFGRPDHQSLLLLLLAVALGAEWRLSERISRGWAVTAGAAWGMALWVSLYEPLVLLGAIVLLWAAGNRRGLVARERLAGWAVMAGILLVALALEGWRVQGLAPAETGAWFSTIGELQSGLGLLRWTGWGVAVSIGGWLTRPARDRRLAAIGLLLLLGGLSFFTLRWGCYFVLAYAMTLPWQLARWRRPWAVWLTGIALAWPLWRELDAMLPGRPIEPFRQEARADQVRLRQAADWLHAQPEGAVMAPWWQSAALAYWSGHPAVAGSSHESLPGIEASAYFYLTVDQPRAASILRQRNAHYVLAYDADRVIEALTPLAGRPRAPEASIASILYRTPRSAPPFLRHEYSNAVFKIFVVPDDGAL